MKILLIVIIALASDIHGEETEGRSDNYSLEKDNATKKQVNNDGTYAVTESNNEYSSFYPGHDDVLQTNEGSANRQGRIMTKSKRQPLENKKNSVISYQYAQHNPANDYSRYGNVIYKPYPLFIKSFDSVPVKQTVATQFNNFANFPQRRHQISTPKQSKPFIPSPQIFEREYGSTGFANTKYQLSGYESNQYKTPVQYLSKPITWAGGNNGIAHGYGVNDNEFEKSEGYSHAVNGYASSFRNGYETIKAYNPVVPGFRISSTNIYSARKFGAPRALDFNDHKTQTVKTYKSPQVPAIEYNSAPAPVKENYYEPDVVSGNEIGNAEKQIKGSEFETQGHQQYMYVLPKEYTPIPSINGNVFESTETVNKVPDVNTYGNQQYMYVAPQAFAPNPSAGFGSQKASAQFGNSFQQVPNFATEYNKDYLSTPSFQSSLRDIVKMVGEEQRKSNGKAIFLIGKPQIPQHMLSNMNRYPSPSNQQGFSSNINSFNGYKY